MNKAKKGNQQEILYTKELNKKKKYWDKLSYEIKDTFAIHITAKKYAKINDAKISTKADLYFATGKVPIEYLMKNDFYLSEDDVTKFKLKFIPQSGVSIKLPNSNNYTITKISPSTFVKIFGDNMLGAGASIYCLKEKDFIKNKSVLKGWDIHESEFIDYFKNNLNNKVEYFSLDNRKTLELIKTYSNKEISKTIIESERISDLIFKGIGNFEEPYTAFWIIENDELKPNFYMPFNITTGSGRSKGIFTIVLKPK